MMPVPVPIDVPPQLPAYHFQLAPTPRLPPVKESDVLLLTQMGLVPVAAVAGKEVS